MVLEQLLPGLAGQDEPQMVPSTWLTCCWSASGWDLVCVSLVGWVMLDVLSPRSCKSHHSCTVFHLPSVNAFSGFLGSQALVGVRR